MISRRVVLGALFVLIIVAAASFYVVYNSKNIPSGSEKGLQVSRTMTLDGLTLNIAVADTESLRERGLGGVRGLSDDEGMLFVFPEDGIYSFWMKDMLFPIDMLWLDAQGSVVYIENSISPNTYPKAFTPDSPARYVLELRAGFSEQHDIRIGSKASLE
jgi:uncharacterized membrane protein (UPF0127 family)